MEGEIQSIQKENDKLKIELASSVSQVKFQ